MANAQVEEWKDHIIDTPSRGLGPRASYAVMHDPRHLAFVLARYKFASKILRGKRSILEVGCGDAFGAPLLAQEAESVLCVDANRRLIEDDQARLGDLEKIRFEVLDIVRESPAGLFEGAVSLDVLEHIPAESERRYFENICASLAPDAIFVLGTPNVAADRFASRPGSSPHINLKDEAGLRRSFAPYFQNTLIFSMNDEVVHTGFTPMSHYLFAVGVGNLFQTSRR